MSELTISKSSRLGKYYDLMYKWLPGDAHKHHGQWINLNLCRFVHRLWLWTLVNFISYGLAAGLTIAVGFCLGFFVYWMLAHGWVWPPEMSFAGTVLRIGATLWCIAAVIGVLVGVFFFKDWIDDRNYKRYIESRGAEELYRPNIVWSWIRAKKQKACPLIRVVD